MNTGDDEAWSSGESEPEEDVITDRTIACDVDLLDNERDENIPDVHYDPYFYPSIKTFTEQTNLFQEQNPEPDRIHMKPWTPITEDELWIIIALSINMGHVVKGQLKDYWSRDPLLYTPIYGEKHIEVINIDDSEQEDEEEEEEEEEEMEIDEIEEEMEIDEIAEHMQVINIDDSEEEQEEEEEMEIDEI
ncbi:glutamic acid-rich protein-like, partial [Odontomachus brunneus]|uniref:glutamic acid-rich protein-like n=1 Tax=Odontomachus brunneus TaxID=486640 RepID=UPI0013F2A07B